MRTKILLTALCILHLLTGCKKEPVEEPESEPVENVKNVYTVWYDKKVRFAPGNLAEGGKGFTTNQYDIGGRFGWTSSTDAEGNEVLDDWGKQLSGGWRTLSIFEWRFLFGYRTDSSNKMAIGSVNGINGMILLPDEWTLPSGCRFTAGFGNGWSTNSYTKDQWKQMESNGAIFLPVSGEGRGNYWSSTIEDEIDRLVYLSFSNKEVVTSYFGDRDFNYPVRLVKDLQ